MEQVVGGDLQHGAVVTTLMNGTRLLSCRCRRVVHEGRWRSHQAQHRREHVVWRTSMDVNAATIAKRNEYARLTDAAKRSIADMTPKRRAPRGRRRQ